MTTQNYEVGQEVTIEKRTYKITCVQSFATSFPNIKKARPHLDLFLIVRGKRGALKSCFTTLKGGLFFLD